MRLTEIEAIKAAHCLASQPLYPAPETALQPLPAHHGRPTLKRRLLHSLSPWLLANKMPRWQREFGHLLPDCRFTCGYRFTEGWVDRRFKQVAGSWQGQRVLLPGSHFNTQEARRWFPRPVKALHLLDIVDWTPSFDAANPQLQAICQAPLSFHHGTLDHLPLPDASIDLIESRAVLEHVGNLHDSATEMARVLAHGGLMLHAFGPLYYTHGGDHCIASLGLAHGFDHLLLDDADYEHQLRDEATFDRLGKEASDARYWALQRIFSYLRPSEYQQAFAPHFDTVESLAIINPMALAFRQLHPKSWQQLLAAGLNEADLLVGSLILILKKKGSLPA